MDFSDKTLIEILETMRTLGGRKLSPDQWQALMQTQSSAEQSADNLAAQRTDLTWYHVRYYWDVITMAAFLLARVSAQKAGQTLFSVRAIDQALTVIHRAVEQDLYGELLKIPSIQSIKRLPAVVLCHQGMRVRFTTTLQQPFVVQDVEGTIVGFDPDDKVYDTKVAVDAEHCQSEHVCGFMPKAIYVKIDECDFDFLPPAPCSAHRSTGHDASCLNCISAVQPGVFAVKSLSRNFKYYYDCREKNYITIQRKQFPLIPALAMTLYSMQGTTAEPGMFVF